MHLTAAPCLRWWLWLWLWLCGIAMSCVLCTALSLVHGRHCLTRVLGRFDLETWESTTVRGCEQDGDCGLWLDGCGCAAVAVRCVAVYGCVPMPAAVTCALPTLAAAYRLLEQRPEWCGVCAGVRARARQLHRFRRRHVCGAGAGGRVEGVPRGPQCVVLQESGACRMPSLRAADSSA